MPKFLLTCITQLLILLNVLATFSATHFVELFTHYCKSNSLKRQLLSCILKKEVVNFPLHKPAVAAMGFDVGWHKKIKTITVLIHRLRVRAHKIASWLICSGFNLFRFFYSYFLSAGK